MQKKQSVVTIACSDYEEGSTAVFIYTEGGLWSGGLTFYIDNQTFKGFFDELIGYTSKSDPIVLECGKPTKAWAYYVKLEAKPVDGWGHIGLNVYLIDTPNQKSVELSILCTQPQINQLGTLIKKAYTQRTQTVWEVDV